ERILAAPCARPERFAHGGGELEERARFVSVVLADDDFALALELILSKQRSNQRAREKPHAAFDAVGRKREIVVDPLFASGAVEFRTKLRGSGDEIVRIGIRRVGLEEHVLVEVREPLVLRTLRERAVLDV